MPVDRKGKGYWSNQSGSQFTKPIAFSTRAENQAKLAMCQVPEPAMDHPSRSATGAAGEIPFLHQNNTQPSYGGIPGNPGPSNTSSNHDDVK